MTRRRRNAAPATPQGRTRRETPGQRARRRIAAQPDVELTDEELAALADEGIDPEDVRRIARERGERTRPVSEHDMDTPRDELEGLTFDDDYE